MNCINCDKQTSNPKFCSRSCAVVYNNQIQAKRKKTNACEHCGETIYRGRTYCRKCWNNRRLEKMTQALDGTTLMAEYGQRAYQRNSRIRDWARTIYANSGLPRICTNCRYDKHVEICHIQAINSFPETTPLSIVNSLDNLTALCPNCHWEFDNGLLRIDAIVKERSL